MHPVAWILRALRWALLAIAVVWTGLAINAWRYFNTPDLTGVLYAYRFAFEVIDLPEARVPHDMRGVRKLTNQELIRMSRFKSKLETKTNPGDRPELYYTIFVGKNKTFTGTDGPLQVFIIDDDRICWYADEFICNHFFVDHAGQLYSVVLYEGVLQLRRQTLLDYEGRKLDVTKVGGTSQKESLQ